MNSELLYITRKLGYTSSFGTRAGLGDFLEQYPDGVYAENGGGAPIGWESAAVWFGGDSERAAARFERMMSERNELSRLLRTRIAGVLVLTFIYRLKSRMVTAIPIFGGQPVIDQTWLYFTMPQGGTVTLTKNGTPTDVTLEYSLDNGSTWTEWVESGNVRSLTLAAGQTMHVRNTSGTSTGFSTGEGTNYYNFNATAETIGGGDVKSLLCKDPLDASFSTRCFSRLFYDFQNLTKAPDIYPEGQSAKLLAQGCFYYMFANTGIETAPVLLNRVPPTRAYLRMFSGCANLTSVTTYMDDISASNCINSWMEDVSPTGDFYCPAELTIPTGASGIPNGWTRHDI